MSTSRDEEIARFDRWSATYDRSPAQRLFFTWVHRAVWDGVRGPRPTPGGRRRMRDGSTSCPAARAAPRCRARWGRSVRRHGRPGAHPLGAAVARPHRGDTGQRPATGRPQCRRGGHDDLLSSLGRSAGLTRRDLTRATRWGSTARRRPAGDWTRRAARRPVRAPSRPRLSYRGGARRTVSRGRVHPVEPPPALRTGFPPLSGRCAGQRERYRRPVSLSMFATGAMIPKTEKRKRT